MAPFDLWALLGPIGGFFAYLAIGFAFGFVLESAGFGDSRVLTGQFYFRDLSVLRVMMTGILTAMLLVLGASSLGLMDFQDVYVNPTYMVPGVVGGFVVGLGFIIGGYCPGTSLASAGSGKLDAMWFVGGVLAGVFAFGELADGMAVFLHTTDWGRVTLDQTFGVPVWVAVAGSIGFGLLLFTMMNSLKTVFWKDDDPGRLTVAGRRLHPAVLLIPAAALLVPIAWFGLPDADEAYALREDTYEPRLESREVHVDPAELLKYLYEDSVVVEIVDVRDESSYNLFHLRDALHVPLDDLDRIWTQDDEPNRIVVVTSNDEAAATVAWRRLTAMKVANVYILDGGVNNWLDVFGAASVVSSLPPDQRPHDDTLCHTFDAALGERHHAALPSHHELEHYLEHHEFEPHVKIVTAARKGGGCG